MTGFESLPDVPESSESSLESKESGSVVFDDAPFPKPEEAATLQNDTKQANQLAWIIAIVALVFLCLCCLGIFGITLFSTLNSDTYTNQFINVTCAQVYLTSIL